MLRAATVSMLCVTALLVVLSVNSVNAEPLLAISQHSGGNSQPFMTFRDLSEPEETGWFTTPIPLLGPPINSPPAESGKIFDVLFDDATGELYFLFQDSADSNIIYKGLPEGPFEFVSFASPGDTRALGGDASFALLRGVIIPEPSTFALAALGFLCIVGCRLRRRFHGLT